MIFNSFIQQTFIKNLLYATYSVITWWDVVSEEYKPD